MHNEDKALAHINAERPILVKNYGKYAYGHWMCGGDSGWRMLIRCAVCGGLYLMQHTEIHFMESANEWYDDYFPVSSAEEAEEICKQFDGDDLIEKFNDRFLRATYGNTPTWCFGFRLSKEQKAAIKEKYNCDFPSNW